jgi:aryl sulfotransferase
VLPKFDKIVYIIRDPRDAALSHARFVLTPYMKKYFPNDFESKEEYLEKQLEGKLTSWVQHVAPYIAYSDDFDIHVVFYERLLNSFADELDRLVDYLEVTLTEQERRSVEEAVTFQSMKEENPEHVTEREGGKVARSDDGGTETAKQDDRRAPAREIRISTARYGRQYQTVLSRDIHA